MQSNRRSFLKKLAYSAASLPIGLQLGKSYVKTNLLKASTESISDKKSLKILSERPLNLEANQHLLDDEVTPTDKIFVRSNGNIPTIAYSKDAKDWKLEIDGEVHKTLSLSLEDLKKKFKTYTYQLVLECGGNGRAGFVPKTEGLQWTYGAVACPMWEGVRLKDVLEYAGLKKSAYYLAYYGHDSHLSGDPNKVPISRGFPIEKALDPMTMIAFGLNREALPPLHGFPARIVCPGFPGSTSGKWLKKLWIRDKVHDGPKMTGKSYRIPKYPVEPGQTVPENDFEIIEKMPVKSMITFPISGYRFSWNPKHKFLCRGFAWSGSGDVTELSISYNFGKSWIKTNLKKPRNRFAWQRWEANFSFPSKGYYEIWARAKDKAGHYQPLVVPGWNPRGYLNNAMPRIAVYADA